MPTGDAEEGRRRRAAPARRVYFHPDPAIFGAKLEFDADADPRAPRGQAYLHAGLQDHLRATRRPARRSSFAHAERHRRLPAEDRRRARHEAAVARRRRSTLERERRTASRLELALQWTEATDEHVRSYVNGIPTALGRHARERACAPAIGKAVRNFIETHNLVAEGRDAHRRGHPRGRSSACSACFVARAAVPGADQGSAEQPRGRGAVDGVVRPALEHWLNDNTSVGRGDRRAHHPRGARARGAPRGARGGVAQDARRRHRLNLPGKLADCTSTDPRRERALHRRGRLGRRLGEAGPRPHDAGDPAAARQGAEHRAGVDSRRCSRTRSCRTS